MQKLSIIALAAVLALGLSQPAFAAATTAPPTGGGGSTVPDPDPGCTGDCDPHGPGEPFVPPEPECQINCETDDPGEPGKPGEPTPEELAQLSVCEHKLSSLGEVKADQIASLANPSTVGLLPICEIRSLAGVKPMLIEKGNAEGLEAVIKNNELIRSKLRATAYKPDDVVGIEFDAEGDATIYVHRRS